MSLKSRIRYSNLMKIISKYQLVMPGEPMIYSVKFKIGARQHERQYFEKKKWASILRCVFPSFWKTQTPVVLIATLYVSPPPYVKVTESQLKLERTPAVHSFELADYYLFLADMIIHNLVNSHRQVVKIDITKFYSKKPRTILKFLSWSNYVKLQNGDTLDPETESLRNDDSKRRKKKLCEHVLCGNDKNKKLCKESVKRSGRTSIHRTASCNSSFRDSSVQKIQRGRSKKISSHATCS